MLGTEPKKAGPLLSAVKEKGVDRVLGLFDFDGEGHGQWNGTIKANHAVERSDEVGTCAYRKREGAEIWAALLPVPPHRSSYAGLGEGFRSKSMLTIELLFPDDNVERLLKRVPAVGVVDSHILKATDKQKVAEAAATFGTDAFKAFEPLIVLIETIAKTSI